MVLFVMLLVQLEVVYTRHTCVPPRKALVEARNSCVGARHGHCCGCKFHS